MDRKFNAILGEKSKFDPIPILNIAEIMALFKKYFHSFQWKKSIYSAHHYAKEMINYIVWSGHQFPY